MSYVWLRYIGKTPADVLAVTTTDGKRYKTDVFLMVEDGDVFLCEKENAKKYKSREFEEDIMDNEGNFNIGHGITETKNITELDKRMYYIKWTNFERKRITLLHYLCETKSDYLFGNLGKKLIISFDDIRSWILAYHHEHLSNANFPSYNFNVILESLETDGFILCYTNTNKGSGKIDIEIVLLDPFFSLPEIEKCKKEYEIKEHEESIKTLPQNETIEDKQKKTKKGKYDYVFGSIKIKTSQIIVFSEEEYISSTSDFNKIVKRLSGDITQPKSKLKKALGLLYAILASNSKNLKSRKIDFVVDKGFITLYDGFFEKFIDIMPPGNNKARNKQPYDYPKVASNRIHSLRDVLSVVAKNIKLNNKGEKKDREHPFEYSLFL